MDWDMVLGFNNPILRCVLIAEAGGVRSSKGAASLWNTPEAASPAPSGATSSADAAPLGLERMWLVLLHRFRPERGWAVPPQNLQAPAMDSHRQV